MAGSRAVSRLSTRLPSLSLKPNAVKSPLPNVTRSKLASQSQISSSENRICGISRLPVELSCLISMMPLHSTIANTRLRSSLPIGSQKWGLIPQGISMPL